MSLKLPKQSREVDNILCRKCWKHQKSKMQKITSLDGFAVVIKKGEEVKCLGLFKEYQSNGTFSKG